MGAQVELMSREYWTERPFTGRIRHTAVPECGEEEVLVETLVSGISRGTEVLIHRGEVPAEVTGLMRAPFQKGELPHPVSHGYLNVGVVRQGPPELQGRTVFTLAGHRDHVVVSTQDCHPVPEGCPVERALLAGAAEASLNALWEAQTTIGDRIAVVGGGLIGLTTALLAARLPLQRLEVVDIDPQRRGLVTSLGLPAVEPGAAAEDNDVVLHSSADAAGLAEALRITGDDGTVVEQSWYGETCPKVPLGGDFHARRLRLVASQVNEVASPRRLRRSRTDRLGTALDLLDKRFDRLITGRSDLGELPQVMDDLASDAEWTRSCVLHVIDHRGRRRE